MGIHEDLNYGRCPEVCLASCLSHDLLVDQDYSQLASILSRDLWWTYVWRMWPGHLQEANLWFLHLARLWGRCMYSATTTASLYLCSGCHVHQRGPLFRTYHCYSVMAHDIPKATCILSMQLCQGWWHSRIRSTCPVCNPALFQSFCELTAEVVPLFRNILRSPRHLSLRLGCNPKQNWLFALFLSIEHSVSNTDSDYPNFTLLLRRLEPAAHAPGHGLTSATIDLEISQELDLELN